MHHSHFLSHCSYTHTETAYLYVFEIFFILELLHPQQNKNTIKEPDAASLEGAEVEKVSAGGPGFAGVGLKYFKSASEERRGVYVTIGCYIILIKKLLMVKPS